MLVTSANRVSVPLWVPRIEHALAWSNSVSTYGVGVESRLRLARCVAERILQGLTFASSIVPGRAAMETVVVVGGVTIVVVLGACWVATGSTASLVLVSAITTTTTTSTPAAAITRISTVLRTRL